MRRNNKITLFILLGLYISTLGCNDSVQVTLNTDDYKLVDSLYKIASRELKMELDSSCIVNKQIWLETYKDSIRQERLLEISKLLQEP